MNIKIIHTNSIDEARTLVDDGYEAIECSFGKGSVIGPLEMDHHGEYSHLEGVALRAYRDHFGARKDDPRFVVTGAADADATFAIAALAGIIPHPKREFPSSTPPHIIKAGQADLISLAQIIDKVDTAPIGVRLEETDEGTLLLLWNQLGGSVQDAMEFYAGVARWRSMLTRRPTSLLEGARREEATRVEKAREAKITQVSEFVAVVESDVWGYDVWYAEVAPIIVALTPRGNITVGCQDTATVENLLGDGGFKPLWSDLSPEGWGGRETIGGSPRGRQMSREEAIEAAHLIATKVVR